MPFLRKIYILDQSMRFRIVIYVFMAMYIGLNNACKNNRIEIHNQLAPGLFLQYQCRQNVENILHGVSYLKFNESHTISFRDVHSIDRME